MNSIDPAASQRAEGRALTISMWGNLFMGAAGISAAVLSNSQAILVDGLFSMIGFMAAIFGRKITTSATTGPDRVRPFGYAADEAIFITFRSLSLLGLVLFALVGAAMRIFAYVSGEEPVALNFAPMLVYFTSIGLTCALLWFFHDRAWRKTGKRSDILRLESNAAAFDGMITLCAGAGLVGIHLFRNSFLAPIAPIGDSIIVLILCATVVTRYYQDFLKGLGELAGVTAEPEQIKIVRRAIRETITADGGELKDLTVSKIGRSYWVVVYYNPLRPLSADQVDVLNNQLQEKASSALAGADVILLITEQARRPELLTSAK